MNGFFGGNRRSFAAGVRAALAVAFVAAGGCGGGSSGGGTGGRPATPTPTPTPAAYAFPSYVTRYEIQAAAYEQGDVTNPKPKGQVVFYGSSSIEGWRTLATDFPQIASINRGIGGSTMAEAAYFADRLVTSLEPNTVVLYEGDNDPFDAQSPRDILAAHRELVRRVRAKTPSVRFLILGIKPSPARQQYFSAYRETNRLLRQWAEKDGNSVLIDTWSAFLGPDGKPNPALFVGDGVHLTPEAYQIWTTALKPYF